MKLTPLPLYGLRDYDRRLARRIAGLEGAQHLRDIMAVDLESTPAEGFPLGRQRLQLHYLAGPTVVLDGVPVYDGRQRVELVVGRRHGSLPHLALVALAVAQQHVGACRPAIHPRRECGANPERQALSQRTAGHLHARSLDMGMALKPAVDLAEGEQLFFRDVPCLRPGRRTARGRRGPC